MFLSHTPQFDGRPNSVAFLRRIPVSEGEQWITVRGADASRPLLLYLHGGPGATATPLIRNMCPDLEEEFVVVYWDQRGAGKSYSQATEGTMNAAQFVSDGAAVIRWVLDYFERERLIVVGHSWGSFLGVLLAREHPELLHAYVGVGQLVARNESERISYDWVLDRTREIGDTSGTADLERIGPPPWPPDEWVRRLMIQRRFVRRFGGFAQDSRVVADVTSARSLLFQPEYNLFDKINWVRGQIRSERELHEEMLEIDFRESVPRLRVPVFFLQGVHDWQTATSLVEDYYERIDAPHKELHLFEHSAHVVIAEEPEKFVRLLEERVVPIMRASSRSLAP